VRGPDDVDRGRFTRRVKACVFARRAEAGPVLKTDRGALLHRLAVGLRVQSAGPFSGTFVRPQ